MVDYGDIADADGPGFHDRPSGHVPNDDAGRVRRRDVQLERVRFRRVGRRPRRGDLHDRRRAGGDLTYATATAVTRSFTVARKGLTVSGLTATDRIYDATDAIVVTGTPTLVGAVAGDGPSAISLAGSPSGAVANGGDVGVGLPVTVSELSLTGTRSSDYSLTAPTPSATISQRPITITADDATVAPSQPFACSVSVTSGALQGADALVAPACTPTASAASPGTETITISSVGIERSSTSVAGNYAVTYATGTLTVSAATIPDLTASAIDVLYGTDVSTVLGTLNADGGVAATSGGAAVSGTVTHTLGGNAPGVEDAGTYTLNVTFTPTNTATYASATTTRAVTVRKRDLTVIGLTATGRPYDGTTIVTLTGTPTLAPLVVGQPGLLGGDTVTVSGGTGTGTLADASAGSSRPVTVTGLSITGADAVNYTFAQPTGLTVDITAVPLTITADDAVKVGGQAEPTFSVAYAGFITGEDEDDLTGTVTVSRPAGETAGTYALTPAGATSADYTIMYVSGTLYVVELAISANESGGRLTDRAVTCACDGLAPGSTATLTIFSTPTVVDSVTVDANGECPGLGDDIPGSVPDGDHTLQLDGVAPDTGGTAVSIVRAVRLGSPGVGSSSRGGGGGGGAEPTPPSESEETAPAPSRPVLRGPVRVPPGSVPGPTTGGAAEPGPVVRPAPVTPPASPDPASPGGPAAPTTDSLDVGGGGRPDVVPPRPDAPLREVIEATRGTATRQLDELGGEALGGFAPGNGVRIEVIGSRTTARFVLSATERIDAVVLGEALRRSAPTQAADFAELVSVAPAERPTLPDAWSEEERAAADDLFAASRLPSPVLVGDLDLPAETTWLRLELRASTYLPGSTVHLTVTSDPIVLASAVVARDGTVVVVGDLPVEVLPAGEHRIRLVGIRSIDGVGTDEQGEIVLPDDVLAEIERFDLGTDATVRVIGANVDGGTHTSVRIVPLDPTPPWWTLWVVALVGLLVGVLRRRGRLEGRTRRLGGVAANGASAVPAVVLGWIATTTEVVWWGIGLATLVALVDWTIVPVDREPDEDASATALSASG